jgi:hypothetical protein
VTSFSHAWLWLFHRARGEPHWPKVHGPSVLAGVIRCRAHVDARFEATRWPAGEPAASVGESCARVAPISGTANLNALLIGGARHRPVVGIQLDGAQYPSCHTQSVPSQTHCGAIHTHPG